MILSVIGREERLEHVDDFALFCNLLEGLICLGRGGREGGAGCESEFFLGSFDLVYSRRPSCG